MRSKTHVVLSACAVALAVSLTGCVHARPVSQARGGRAAPAALSAGAAALITMSGSYYADEQALNTAESVLTHKCMVAHGFRYQIPAASDPQGQDEEWRPDLAARRVYGYGLRPGSSPPQAERAADTYVRSLPPARQARYHRILFGDTAHQSAIVLPGGQEFTFATQGCIAESRTRIYGSAAAAMRIFYLPQDFFIMLYPKAVRSASYRPTLAAWSTCMSQHGYHYSSPDVARQQVAARYRTLAPQAAQRHEIAVAVQDGMCADKVRMTAIFTSLLGHYAQQMPTAYRRQLNGVAAAREAAIQRTKQVIT